MEVKQPFVFQADSEIVRNYYRDNPNYIIEYNKDVLKEYCILYFSSHNIYSNTESAFKREIIRKNRFEWYGTRIRYGYKHIFIRDIIKQWYLTGISSELNTPDLLLEFLKKETEKYKVIALGSSAGGFASVVYGQLLHAERIFTFNGQFQVNSVLRISDESKDPVIFRNRDNTGLRPYYDARNFITNPGTINYFYSKKSDWDIEQKTHIEDLGMGIIEFRTGHHGIPFLKSNLPALLNLKNPALNRLPGKSFHPLLFSFKMVGFFKTMQSLMQISVVLVKRFVRRG